MKIKLAIDIVRYNLKIVFANKFVYFLIAAVGFFLLIMGIALFAPSSEVTVEDIYSTLILPGILIIFYPILFSIQNDKDARMLEIIFGVPNYRYKVYLLRFAISIGLMVVMLLCMSGFAVFAVLRIPVLKMVYQLMFPLIFLACVGFLMASLTRNASGAAVVMIVIGLFFWILNEPLEFSKWNIFINPFNAPTNMSLTVWNNIVTQNRLMLVVGSAVSLLWSLINLQRREKFV
ncbi:MAG: hypothetical protein RBT74_12855 [Tenuifilaceae bacterium]|jgi:hypothetical protein|nr:hypothetical protein [Tenuifilaceae bacterium]